MDLGLLLSVTETRVLCFFRSCNNDDDELNNSSRLLKGFDFDWVSFLHTSFKASAAIISHFIWPCSFVFCSRAMLHTLLSEHRLADATLKLSLLRPIVHAKAGLVRSPYRAAYGSRVQSNGFSPILLA